MKTTLFILILINIFQWIYIFQEVKTEYNTYKFLEVEDKINKLHSDFGSGHISVQTYDTKFDSLQKVQKKLYEMKISIIHPTRKRPDQAIETRGQWLLKADNPDAIEYLFSTDSDDETTKHFSGVRGPNKSAIEAINRAAKIATGDLFIVVSDDFSCPLSWDTLLIMAIDDREDFVAKTQDGIQPVLITLPILDRKFYNRFGYVYNPEFRHMGADCELTAVGIMLGRFVNIDLFFEHRHYSTGKTAKDEINEKNDLTYAHGDEILAKHRENNFGIEKPVCTYDQIIWHPQY